MNRKILLDLPKEISEDNIPLFVFLTKLTVEGRTYTGYKELDLWGIDSDQFLTLTDSTINKKGAIKVNLSGCKHIIINPEDPNKERYVLDPEIFEYEYDLFTAFEERDPVWFTPYKEISQYDEEMFNQLPEQLQNWFLRKIKKGITSPAQDLLDHTYQKYVVRKEPLLNFNSDQIKENNS